MKINDRQAVINEIAQKKTRDINTEEAIKYDGIVALNVYEDDILITILKRPEMSEVRKNLLSEGAIQNESFEDLLKTVKQRLEKGNEWDPELYGALKKYLNDEANKEDHIKSLLNSLDDQTIKDAHLKHALEEWLIW